MIGIEQATFPQVSKSTIQKQVHQCYSFSAVAQNRGYNPLFVSDAVILPTKEQ